VVALSSVGDRRDVQRTKQALKIAFQLVPGPNQRPAEEFGVWDSQRRLAIGSFVIGKDGVVRFAHTPRTGDADRPRVSDILKVLQELK